jgi:prepilin-type N-terminal cleavage/methylation domain-containing protein
MMRMAKQATRSRRSHRGFTLVELLVTIAIIGILIGLLVPAVQSVRESARMANCKNNLRQVAQACIQHEGAHGHWPDPGGFYNQSGDPDDGFDKGQQGGWLYSILPYLEQMPLYQLGAGGDTAAKSSAKATRAGTVVAAYICPSRGSGLVRVNSGTVFGASPFARTDYGGNAEGLFGNFRWNLNDARGAFSRELSDGLSNILLCGERYLNPDRYRESGVGTANRYEANAWGWTNGQDQNNLCRTTPWSVPARSAALSFHKPTQDTPGKESVIMPISWPAATGGIAFGSPHATFHVALCDGSVRGVEYSIDGALLTTLAFVDDGGAADELDR